jgi:hypothetical protein
MSTEEKQKETRYIRVSKDWFDMPNRKTGESPHLLEYYDAETLYLTSLIQFRFTIYKESRFSASEIKMWFGSPDMRLGVFREKFNKLNKLRDEGLFEITEICKDTYYVNNIEYQLFIPTSNYVRITEEEIQKILSNKTKISNGTLFTVFTVIKAFMGSHSLYSFPSIHMIHLNTLLCDKTVSAAINVLISLKLIARIERGWDKENFRNYGYIYTLWSEDCESRLSDERLRMAGEINSKDSNASKNKKRRLSIVKKKALTDITQNIDTSLTVDSKDNGDDDFSPGSF